MKIIFMGTPDFAVPSLKAITASHHEVVGIVTGPDKPTGRGQIMHTTPVKSFARELSIPIYQPESLKRQEFFNQLRGLKADIIVVVAFRILPDEVLTIPPKGAINLHASLLPKYRGAAPINWALINGEPETGITIFQIRLQVDTGEILWQERVPIAAEDTFGSLHDRLATIGATALIKVLDKMEQGEVYPVPQDHSATTLAPKIYPQLGEINWTDSARSIKCLIHGLSPTPGAYTFFNSKRIKILSADYSDEIYKDLPGAIVVRDKQRLGIQTGQGLLYPRELQWEGKKTLPVAEFLKGFKAGIGDRFPS
jgi:methionyl-tRNA formyltransferase